MEENTIERPGLPELNKINEASMLIKNELSKVIVGQKEMMDLSLRDCSQAGTF